MFRNTDKALAKCKKELEDVREELAAKTLAHQRLRGEHYELSRKTAQLEKELYGHGDPSSPASLGCKKKQEHLVSENSAMAAELAVQQSENRRLRAQLSAIEKEGSPYRGDEDSARADVFYWRRAFDDMVDRVASLERLLAAERARVARIRSIHSLKENRCEH